MRFRSLPSAAARGTRLALETLEHRTLLSAVGLTTGFQPSSMELDNSAVYETVQDAPAFSAGDANRDGLFDQRDLVEILQAGKYLTGESAVWGEGDWNGDNVFDQGDLIAALQTGNYANAGVSAHQADILATVDGNGIATMTATADDVAFGAFVEGESFADNQFKIKVKVHADGSASGTAFFDFGEEFSNIWGLSRMTLKGKIDSGEVLGDGTVVLQGTSYEKDFAPGVVFKETSPFEIIVDPSGDSFTLRWCELPALDFAGHLSVS